MPNNCPLNKEDLIFNLQNGLIEEQKALELYQNSLKDLESPVNQKVISGIIKDEARHIKVVENLIKLVEEWYQSN